LTFFGIDNALHELDARGGQELLVLQGRRRINAESASQRHEARDNPNDREQQRNGNECRRIGWRDLIELQFDEAGSGQGHCQASYHNSAENPRNPSSPPKRVLWGVQSLDEMGIVRFQMAVANKEDEPAVQAFMVAAVKAAISQAVKDGTLKRLAEEQRKLKGGGDR
jgi:hypothetical protein